MPRLFFDTYDQDKLSKDEEGIECSSRSDVQRRAVDALPDMAREVLPDGPNHDFRVEVRNSRGDVIFQASLNLRSEWTGDFPGSES